jgi:pimeloyl-ACP methyl ester carboxylesterase
MMAVGPMHGHALGQVPAATLPAATDKSNEPAGTEPQQLELVTKDYVLIRGTYYPGTLGRKTVPVILLHGGEGPRGAGSGQDVTPLALKLQAAGHAVVVPDLRGHGRSRVRQVPGQSPVYIDREHLRPVDVRAMILDVEAVRSFLVEQNNAERLNIEQLCVVGFEMGSIVALNWILYDWSVPSWPTLKQGQDVKAFVLVSPGQTFKGVDVRRALANPVVCGQLSAMIIYGKDDPERETAKRVHTTLRRSHRLVPTASTEPDPLQDLFLVELDTRLRGTKLLGNQVLSVADRIVQFIQLRLVDQADSFPWRDRSHP